MPARRILVASPVEPSGGSWLLNCLLELGIKVGHKPFVDNVWRGSHPRPDANHIWIAKDGGFELNPKAASLTTFLPILARQTRFFFRDDVEVEYVQDFPARTPDDRSVVLIVRDPRDALYSMYRRVAPGLSFEEFLRFPNPATLLDRPAHWTLFVACWLACPDLHVVRFEDYKRDAEATLRRALAALDLHYDDARIADALHQSSFEKAREAEARFRERVPGEHQVANRAGQVGEGRSRPEVQATIAEIEAAASPALQRLGYDVLADTRQRPIRSGAAEPRIPLHLRRHRRPGRNRRNPARHCRIGARSLLSPRLGAPARRRSRRPRRPSPRRGADAVRQSRRALRKLSRMAGRSPRRHARQAQRRLRLFLPADQRDEEGEGARGRKGRPAMTRNGVGGCGSPRNSSVARRSVSVASATLDRAVSMTRSASSQVS